MSTKNDEKNTHEIIIRVPELREADATIKLLKAFKELAKAAQVKDSRYKLTAYSAATRPVIYKNGVLVYATTRQRGEPWERLSFLGRTFLFHDDGRVVMHCLEKEEGVISNVIVGRSWKEAVKRIIKDYLMHVRDEHQTSGGLVAPKAAFNHKKLAACVIQ